MADRFAVEVAENVTSMLVAVLRKEGLLLSNGSDGAKALRPVPKLLVKPSEAGEMLSRTEKAIRRLIDRGELKAVRHGRTVRIAVADILALIEADRG